MSTEEDDFLRSVLPNLDFLLDGTETKGTIKDIERITHRKALVGVGIVPHRDLFDKDGTYAIEMEEAVYIVTKKEIQTVKTRTIGTQTMSEDVIEKLGKYLKKYLEQATTIVTADQEIDPHQNKVHSPSTIKSESNTKVELLTRSFACGTEDAEIMCPRMGDSFPNRSVSSSVCNTPFDIFSPETLCEVAAQNNYSISTHQRSVCLQADHVEDSPKPVSPLDMKNYKEDEIVELPKPSVHLKQDQIEIPFSPVKVKQHEDKVTKLPRAQTRLKQQNEVPFHRDSSSCPSSPNLTQPVPPSQYHFPTYLSSHHLLPSYLSDESEGNSPITSPFVDPSPFEELRSSAMLRPLTSLSLFDDFHDSSTSKNQDISPSVLIKTEQDINKSNNNCWSLGDNSGQSVQCTYVLKYLMDIFTAV